MKPYKSQEIESVLTSKGFRKKEGKDHTWLFLKVGGLKTDIRTKVSRSPKTEYGDQLQSEMRKQLRLRGSRNKRLFEDLLACPATYSDYVSALRKQGVIE
ncbi:type II toxin-antitoxin system HicA family toxin [bacterium]|nr:type II toxin-antitoxin system HicA family toxin [bacterium]